jgi:TonB family protein
MRLDIKTTAVLALFCSLAQGVLAQSTGVSENPATGSSCGAAIPSDPSMVMSQEDQSAVTLSVRIKKSGAVYDVRVVSGPPALAEAAIKAANGWKYPRANGLPSERTTLFVTLTAGAAPKVQQVVQAGVPGCIYVPARVRVSQDVMASLLLRWVEPVYPPKAKAEHVEGIVVLRVTIDKGGSVYKADNVSGPSSLAPAAIEAVKQWKYQRYVMGGVPVEVVTTVEISFTL